MGDANEKIPVKPSISSREHEELLNIIDTIRSQGVSRYIDIPQIVVCGDQSSGKSSTLEAICGLRFPTSDGLCTRFATEYVLRRSQDDSVNVSIIPQESDEEERSTTELDDLRNFKPSTFDLEDFTTISKEAADAMGIDKDGKTFSHDVLHIEISGPTQPHLTLVDLPGLFHAGVDKKGDENVEAVNWLVKHYIENPRSIILAVVSAKNDLNLQKVIKFIRDHDAEGNRTLGVITKPDTIAVDSPTEIQYLKVAQNLEVPYALGWHVVKNRSFEQRDWPTQKRDADEEKWLSKGVWNALNTRQKGVSALRVRLSKVLQNHILSELPSLMKDVETGIADCTKRLETLGMSRGTLEQQRRYLLRASEKFARLISASIDGNYTDAFFGSSETDDGYEKRLRAVAVNIMKDFSVEMRLNGHAVKLVDRIPALDLGGPEHITKDAFYKKVQFRMSRNSGRELPGLFNPGIIGDLFFDQSEPWRSIITGTQEKLLDAAHTTIGHVLEHAADEATIGGILREIVNPGMEPLEQGLLTKVEEILKPHLKGHPQTYNHYFTDNIQAKRQEEDRKELTQRLETFFSRQVNSENARDRQYSGSFDMKNLLEALVKHKEVDMDRFAAIEAVNAMLGYYKVALKNVVDAFTMYAIEEVLLTRIPRIFTPESVYTLDENTITRIAGESDQSITERETLTKKLAILKETQKLLHRMDRHKPAGRSVPHQTLESGNNRSARHRPSEPKTCGLELEDQGAEGEEKEDELEEQQSESEEQSDEQSEEQSEEQPDECDDTIEQAGIDCARCISRLSKVDPCSKPSLSLLRIMQAEYVVDRMLNFLRYLSVLPPARRKRITSNLSAVLGALRAIDGLCSDSIGPWGSSVEVVWQWITQTMPWRDSINPDKAQWLYWRSLVVRFADALAEYLENLDGAGQQPKV